MFIPNTEFSKESDKMKPENIRAVKYIFNGRKHCRLEKEMG
jgi:hypothetical protein